MLALHLSRVAKLSTSFGWGKGKNVTYARWQVTLCDPIWNVRPRSSGAGCNTLRTVMLHLFISLII